MIQEIIHHSLRIDYENINDLSEYFYLLDNGMYLQAYPDETIGVFKIPDNNARLFLRPDNGVITFLKILPNGLLLTASINGSKIQLWNLETGV